MDEKDYSSLQGKRMTLNGIGNKYFGAMAGERLSQGLHI